LSRASEPLHIRDAKVFQLPGQKFQNRLIIIHYHPAGTSHFAAAATLRRADERFVFHAATLSSRTLRKD
jgi:hypothetical protein